MKLALFTVPTIWFFELEINLIFSSMIHLKSANDALFVSSRMIILKLLLKKNIFKYFKTKYVSLLSKTFFHQLRTQT